MPSTPEPDLLLARGEAIEVAGRGLSAALLARFGAVASAPYALVAEPGDGELDHERFWMHADPVHLRPDRDQLRLFDAGHLGISRAEADALLAELNVHFAADGLRLVAPAASRWYLTAETPPRLDTTPLEQVSGRSVDGYLPAGPDSRRWQGLMNELQMLLFQSPVNRAREQQGRPAVNAVWTWGGGRWQELGHDGLPDVVLSRDQPLAEGLALTAGARTERLPPTAPSCVDGTILAVFDQLLDAALDGDETVWAAAAGALDDWLSPALKALRSGALHELILDACDGRAWQLGRAHLLRFWRRPRSVAERVRLAAGD